MGQVVFVPKEIDAIETRVAASPETVKRLVGLGFQVVVEKGAGDASRIPDADFSAAGAAIGKASDAGRADLVLKVRRPGTAELAGYKRGALVIATVDPYGNEDAVAALARAGVSAFAMEFMPRITRAQVMDVLSSQANLAGYRAVIDAAAEYDRALPMMMTAAGTVPAAKVFIMGVGVAGLQAIATARRLGAVVTATDVRPAAKEQVASLGAKFLAVEDEEFKAAETAGGYAKEMSKEYQAKQAALTADHIAKQDIVITTALIPGRPAPKLVSAAMVASMKPGSVIVDLAVERGGNVEGAVAGEIVTTANRVRIVGHLNVPGRVASSSSLLYAKNLYAFVETLVDKETGTLKVNVEDELVKATLLTHGGRIVHPNFADAKVEAAPATAKAADNAADKAGPGKTTPGKAADAAPKKRGRKPAVPAAAGDAQAAAAPKKRGRPAKAAKTEQDKAEQDKANRTEGGA
ncbi:MAG: Re/Si-specific NAD(P)(+) transhydrogenase subunit alpha [Hyphomicrobiales bacterium]|nr:MAG: Re/Si-specific NAD(P)(+) transhydrogenase subunit alpha [Hyphomicrobiales bacterium]